MKKINKHLLIFGGILGILFLFSITALGRFLFFLIHENISQCKTIIDSLTSTIIPRNSTDIIFNIGGFFILFFSLRILFVIYTLSKKHIYLTSVKVQRKSITTLLQKYHLEKKVVIIKDNKPLAFCFGFFRPKIYLSTKTLRMMTKKELEAILLHETYHLESRDSLILFIASFTKMLFPLFPFLSDMLNHYEIEREVNADKKALFVQKSNTYIISVLKKMLEFPTSKNVYVYASFISSVDANLEARIKTLIHGNTPVKKFQKFNIFFSFISFILLTVFIVTPVHAVHFSQNGENTLTLMVTGTTIQTQCITKNYSEIPNKNFSSSQNRSYSKDALDR